MLKRNMFGKDFENQDCPELTRCFLNAITLSQTFSYLQKVIKVSYPWADGKLAGVVTGNLET